MVHSHREDLGLYHSRGERHMFIGLLWPWIWYVPNSGCCEFLAMMDNTLRLWAKIGPFSLMLLLSRLFYHSNVQETKTELGTRRRIIAMEILTILCRPFQLFNGWNVDEWKIIECCKHLNGPFWGKLRRQECGEKCILGSQAPKISKTLISNRTRSHSCGIWPNNLPPFCLCPRWRWI